MPTSESRSSQPTSTNVVSRSPAKKTTPSRTSNVQSQSKTRNSDNVTQNTGGNKQRDSESIRKSDRVRFPSIRQLEFLKSHYVEESDREFALIIREVEERIFVAEDEDFGRRHLKKLWKMTIGKGLWKQKFQP